MLLVVYTILSTSAASNGRSCFLYDLLSRRCEAETLRVVFVIAHMAAEGKGRWAFACPQGQAVAPILSETRTTHDILLDMFFDIFWDEVKSSAKFRFHFASTLS